MAEEVPVYSLYTICLIKFILVGNEDYKYCWLTNIIFGER